MRIGLLQFSPKVGEVFNNAQAAEAVLHRADPKDLDLLVLPEMAFSGYNFKTLQEIKPVLEPTGKGFSSVWAKKTADRYACAVVIGYPEVVEVRGLEIDCYNAAAVWGKNRELLANYRKSFLYVSGRPPFGRRVLMVTVYRRNVGIRRTNGFLCWRSP